MLKTHSVQTLTAPTTPWQKMHSTTNNEQRTQRTNKQMNEQMNEQMNKRRGVKPPTLRQNRNHYRAFFQRGRADSPESKAIATT